MQYTFPDGGQPVAELKGSENTITTTIKVLEANYPRLRDFFGISPQKFEVKIVESREELDEYLCRRTERWVVAGGKDATGFAILAPSRFPVESDKPIEHFPKVLTHELVHIFAHNFDTNKILPVWFHEGLALYLAGQDEVVSKRLLKNRLQAMSVEEVMTLMDEQEKFMSDPRFAFSFAFSFIEYLYENYGEPSFRKILESVQASSQNSTAELFEDSLGVSLLAAVETYLREQAAKK